MYSSRMEQTEVRGAGRAGLDRATILDAAVALVDREGLAALNMRALAQELGVGTMSLYHYVPNKDAMLDGITERVLAEIELPAEGSGPWEQRALFMARSFRGVALRHPHCVPLLVTRTFQSPVALRPCEAAFAILAEGGFEPPQALVLFRTILAYCLGFVMMESAGFFGRDGFGYDASELRALGLGRLAALSPHLGGRDVAADFDTGMLTILAGSLVPAGAGA
jgi:AcrR family transcriptional regulator